MVAAYLAARWTGLPLFLYYHNTYAENRTGVFRSLAFWVEERVFSFACALFVISDGLKEHYASRGVPVKVITLPHVNPYPTQSMPYVRETTGASRLAILGNLNDSNLDATQRIVRALGNRPGSSLTIYTATVRNYVVAALGLSDFANIRIATPPDSELLEELQRQDLLLLPHGLTGALDADEYRTIFPTRTVRYLAAGRPILAHVPKDSFLALWLRRRDCAEMVTVPSEAAIAAAVEKLVSDTARRAALANNALHAATEFDGPRVAQRFVESLATGRVQ